MEAAPGSKRTKTSFKNLSLRFIKMAKVVKTVMAIFRRTIKKPRSRLTPGLIPN